MTELVSFVMAVWNPRQRWLREAVDSVLAQRGCELELVVVDDGCPEPVEGMLGDVADARLRIVRIPHGGESQARNAGIAAARGSLVRFVDCDDYLPPNSTARLTAHVSGSDKTIGFGATTWCDDSLRPLWTMAPHGRGDVAIAYFLFRFTVMVPSLLIPRGVVDAAGPWDPAFTVCQDWDFAIRAFEQARVRGDAAPATLYRQYETSASRDLDVGWQGTLLGVRRYFERHPEELGGPLERRAQAMLHILKATLETGGRPWRRRVVWRALAADPHALGTAYAQVLEPKMPPSRLRTWRVAQSRSQLVETSRRDGRLRSRAAR